MIKITPTDSQKKMMKYLVAGGLSLSATMSGVFLTSPSEGERNYTYIDPVGVATACFGHTGSDVKSKAHYTDEECLNLFVKDLSNAEKDVDKVIHVPLNPYQKAALIDFDYNVGVGNLQKSTMAKLFNQGKYTEGCKQLVNWVYAGKTKLPGLVKRRDLELQFCLGNVEITNVYP